MGRATFTDSDGYAIAYRRCLPRDGARAIVVIVHGGSEHGGRYSRAATALAARGLAVYAPDLRGHGATAAATGVGTAGTRGWDGILADLHQLAAIASAEHGDVPLVLFGHSMGSMLAQLYAQRWGDELAGLALSGSSAGLPDLDGLLRLAHDAVEREGDEAPSGQLAGMFAQWNAPFEPARTPFDWLSRDPAEVDAYIADPWCGSRMPLTNGFVVSMLEHLRNGCTPEAEACVPADLPVLLLSGSQDPSNGMAQGMRRLEERYRARLPDVTAIVYEGARHELLNETNRAEVEVDLATWIDRVVAP